MKKVKKSPKPEGWGCLHSGLHQRADGYRESPKPEGWGSFTPAYRKRGNGPPQSPNLPVGVFHKILSVAWV